MTVFKFSYLGNYANHGQDAEQSIRLVLTGRLEKADNRPATECADCLDFQIKSAKATVCFGDDVARAIEDKAERYIYATRDGRAFVMSSLEYLYFLQAFTYVTTDSRTKQVKLRLKDESSRMLKYLERYTRG